MAAAGPREEIDLERRGEERRGEERRGEEGRKGEGRRGEERREEMDDRAFATLSAHV